MADGPYALDDDGTAKDPAAFQQALKSDPEKMEALKEEPESLRIVMGDDMHAFQELIKGVYQVRSAMPSYTLGLGHEPSNRKSTRATIPIMHLTSSD